MLASVRFVIGQTYLAQRRLGDAELHLRAAYELRRNTLGSGAPATVYSMATLAELLLWQGKYGETEPLFTEAAAVFRRLRQSGKVNPLWMIYTLTVGGGAQVMKGNATAAEAILGAGSKNNGSRSSCRDA